MTLAILTFVVAVLVASAPVLCGDSGVYHGETNLTPQNDRVAVFTDSWGTVYYCEFLGVILGRDVLRKRQSGDSADAIMLSSFFSRAGNEYGIIITNYGSTDAHRDYPWEEIEPRMRDLFRRLKATGAIVVYNQIAPESYYHFGKVCEEEGVVRVEENYWLEDIFDYEAEFWFPVPWGRTHPGPWGAAVMAERTARVMLDAGIVEWVEPCEMGTLDFEGLYSDASQLIEDVEQLDLASEEVDVDLEGIVQYLALAEPLYDVGACFITRWLLRDWIMEPLTITVEHWDDIQELFRLWERDFDYKATEWPLRPWTADNLEGYPLRPPEDLSVESMASRLAFSLEHWDEVVEMFANASAVMDAAEEQDISADYQRMCYDLAKAKWRDLDYEGVDALLVKIHSDLEPLLVEESEEEYVTVFCEDFDTDNPQVNWHLSETGWESAGVCDGCAYLNLSEESTSDSTCLSGLFGTLDAVTERTGNWLYVSMDVRMRFSDDNKLNSDFGGGLRYWGLDEQFSYPPNFIHFGSWSPEAGPRAGFDVDVAINDSGVFSADLSGIDMREWHVYTILWEPDGVEFLVDGESVGSTDQSPAVPMSPHVHIWNILNTEGPHLPRIDLANDVWAQIDYLRCYVTKERFDAWSQEVSELMSRADGMVEDLVQAGFDCGEEEEILYLVQGNWVEGNYNYAAAKSPLQNLIAPLSEFLDLLPVRGPVVEAELSEAEECIETLKSEGKSRETTISTADLSRAEKAWWSDLDYEATCTALNNIMARCSEPVLPLLSLLVVPLLLNCIGRKVHQA